MNEQKPLGPRQRKAQLTLLGLAECCRCRRIQPIELMARGKQGRPDTRCRECEANRQRERRRSCPMQVPVGMTPLAAPRLTAPIGGDDYKKAIENARNVLAGIRRGE
jgi:hypothetical protein